MHLFLSQTIMRHYLSFQDMIIIQFRLTLHTLLLLLIKQIFPKTQIGARFPVQHLFRHHHNQMALIHFTLEQKISGEILIQHLTQQLLRLTLHRQRQLLVILLKIKLSVKRFPLLDMRMTNLPHPILIIIIFITAKEQNLMR